MKYMLLIHQGTTPLPGTAEWDALSGEEQGKVYAAYQAVNQTPGTTPGVRMAEPDAATTVRVEDGRTHSAATCSSTPTTSTPRSTSPPRSRRRAWAARSRSAR